MGIEEEVLRVVASQELTTGYATVSSIDEKVVGAPYTVYRTVCRLREQGDLVRVKGYRPYRFTLSDDVRKKYSAEGMVQLDLSAPVLQSMSQDVTDLKQRIVSLERLLLNISGAIETSDIQGV